MLENTMTVFVCLSSWLYLKSHKKQPFLFIVLSGLALSLAVLTKGFVCLYIWTFPFFYWLFFRREDFLRMLFYSVLFILATALPIALLYFLSDDAHKYLNSYFTNQVAWNSQNVRTVSTRFAILGGFFQSVLPPVLIAFFVAGLAYIKKIPLTLPRANYKIALLYFCITLSGVLPIMISLKQSNFYILTVFPFFAIGLGILLLPLIERLINIRGTNWFKHFTIIVFCMLLVSLSIAIARTNKIGRDKNKIIDCNKIIETIGSNQLINICPEIYSDWSLHGYYARNGNISLMPFVDTGYRYYLTSKSCNAPSPLEYKEMDLELKEYRLFIKK
jgi:4-amino-4-deoxy-L-arabinose transferase-like glycosyltransferase